jgi:LacI family transcriptional regulator
MQTGWVVRLTSQREHGILSANHCVNVCSRGAALPSRVTMEDVAERAGVSVTTVSHVVNATRPVSNDLRQRVLAAMEALGYRPNLLARSLRRGHTHTVGMILPDNVNPFFAEVARGVEDEAFARGYSVILCNTDGDVEKEGRYATLLAEKRVDGILFVAAGGGTEQVHALVARGVPLVVVDREMPDLPVDQVLTDNARGGWLATQHLVALGHRRIGCITGPSDLTPSAQRVTGYRRALEEMGIPADERLVVRGDFQYASGYDAARRLLALDEPPTAIFACNDLMAVGAISAALALGRRVPADLSIVGFDDVGLARFANPPLTTVRQNTYEMGKAAVELLLERVREQNVAPRRRVLETSLVVRSSTAAPRCGAEELAESRQAVAARAEVV